MPLKIIKLGVFYGRSDEIRALNMLSGKVSILLIRKKIDT